MISNTPEALPALLDYPSKLFVETTTRCNLLCPMCVKQSKGSCIKLGNMDWEIFDCLKPAFPFLQALVLNGIGEPLMHPHIIDFIYSARQLMPDDSWIGFQSNGLLLDKKCAELLVRSGLDRLCLSVDGIKPESFNKARKGEQLSDIERALAFLDVARRDNVDTCLKIGIEFVVTEINKTELSPTLRWAAGQGVDFAIVSQALPYNRSATRQLAYDSSSDKAVEIFSKWKNKMAKMGLDIYQYNSVARSTGLFAMSSYDPLLAKVMRMVDELRAEARAENVFLDIPSLLRRNTFQGQELMEIFTAAQNVADEVGMELKLPAAFPVYERSCPFVKDGSAFVSWDGNV
ncbi:MAG: radical SAM protein, partial [Desulfobacteraceae bacterium 4572_35.1]